MKTTRRFWPLDYDQEVEIYENTSWDLPGLKRFGKRATKGSLRRIEAKRWLSTP
jgi:hypothetical protein